MRIILISILILSTTACFNRITQEGEGLALLQRNIIERDLTLPYGIDNPNVDKSQIAEPISNKAGTKFKVESTEIAPE